jgi:hypothetical protein
MRYKALPLSIRSGPRSPDEPSRVRPRPASDPHTVRDILATVPIVLLVPLLIVPLLAAQARSPSLEVRGQAVAGFEITVNGTSFQPSEAVSLVWNDGAPTGQPVVTDKKGQFGASVTVPHIAPGLHLLSAVASQKGRKPAGVGTAIVASVEVTVVAATAASPTPDPSSAVPVPPAGSPTPLPSDDPSPSQATAPSASATSLPSSTPAWTPNGTPAPTPIATAVPTTPAPAPVSRDDVAAGAVYVATTGHDANGGTLDRPFRTIGRAVQALGPGSTLYVRGGTYVENLRNPSIKAGTASARVVVKAYPGERPVLQGLLWLKGASYWTIDGLNVTWGSGNGSGDHMVKLTGGTGWVLQNSELWGARSYAALFVGGEPSDWRVLGNCIHDTIATNDTNQDHNIYVNSGLGAGAGYIERNLIFNAPNGRNIKLGGSGTSSSEGSANVTIRSNTLYGASQSISLSGGTRNTLIEWNVIVRATGGALIRAYELGGSGNVVRNNLGYDANELIRTDGAAGLVDAGGNLFPLNPKLSGIACGGIIPADPTAAAYGRWR